MKKIILLLLVFSISLLASTKFLTTDQAFKPSVNINKNSIIQITVKLGHEIYLHKKDFKISLKHNSSIFIKDIKLSKSVLFSHEQIFVHQARATVLLAKKPHTSGKKNITLVLSFIGCSKAGICYQPQTRIYHFAVNTNDMSVESLNTIQILHTKPQLSEVGRITQAMKNGNIVIIILMFLGFGILLAFTPCIFPMIPILSSIIVSQGKNITTKYAFFLSLVYVLSMALAYTIAGVLAGLFGENLQAYMQLPWIIYAFSAIFVILSLSMFGLYEIQMPNFIQSKMNSATNKSGGIIGVAIMGFLSALIVGPCVAAPLAGALVYIGETGNAVLGGISLFALAMGMGLPLLIIGTGAGKFMPKPGAWMNLITTLFGFLMLGVAIWMLSRVMSAYIIMLFWAALGTSTAIYLGALEPLHVKDGIRENSLKKIIGFVILIYSIILFIGAFSGSTSYTHPLNKFTSKSLIATNVDKPKFQIVSNLTQLNTLLQKYKGRKIILDFAANWCVACKELDDKTFSNPQVINAMRKFVLIRADLTNNTPQQKELAAKYGVFGPPVIIFFNKNSQVIKHKTIVGFEGAKEFLKDLR